MTQDFEGMSVQDIRSLYRRTMEQIYPNTQERFAKSDVLGFGDYDEKAQEFEYKVTQDAKRIAEAFNLPLDEVDGKYGGGLDYEKYIKPAIEAMD